MEAAVERDLLGPDLAGAGDDLYPLVNGIPGAVHLIRGRIVGRADLGVAQDQRVECDDFRVRVQDVEGQAPGDVAGYWRHHREDFLLFEQLGHFRSSL